MLSSLRSIVALVALTAPAWSQSSAVWVEAESFADHGGWRLDTQFVHAMGSPFLLAHGLGQPVADAVTTVDLPTRGTWRVLVRTYDWVARWGAPGAPGRFRVLVDGAVVGADAGGAGADWSWHALGAVRAGPGPVEVRLRDLTGFDGRVDALWFTTDPDAAPPDGGIELRAFRDAALGLPAAVPEVGPFDLVVVGGGYGGIAAALSAARMGCRVALLQDRPVLGGNGSSEVRVWAKGGTRRGLYPALGEIVEEFADRATASPGPAEEFGDAHKERVVRAEPNVALFLDTRCDGVVMDGPRIAAVDAFDTRTGARRRFTGRLFCDATGHGFVGAFAGADHTLRTEDHLGASNMWRWRSADGARAFPPTPWALDLTLDDFPYPRDGKGEWFWESGFDEHPLDDLEATRDWNLRAVFGAFQTMKSGARAAEHATAELIWVAHVAGTRESRQILGDVVLTRDDIAAKRAFPDGCVPTTWDIDLHYPREEYAKRHPDRPFISRAHFDRSVDREHGYPVPYRCFYSRNVPNLFLAGRCISVTHEALGTVRVMRTGGMIGEVVGKAASICIARDVSPRAVHAEHFAELQELMRLPGRARRATVAAPIEVPDGVASPRGIAVADLGGIVVDDHRAVLEGSWIQSDHEPGFVGERYLHDGDAHKGAAAATFTLRPRVAGRHRVELAWRSGGNRAAAVPVTVRTRTGRIAVTVDQTVAPAAADGFASLCELDLAVGEAVEVRIENRGTRGHVVVDAVRLSRVDERR